MWCKRHRWVLRIRRARYRRQQFESFGTVSPPQRQWPWVVGSCLLVAAVFGCAIWTISSHPRLRLGDSAGWASAVAGSFAIVVALWTAQSARTQANIERRLANIRAKEAVREQRELQSEVLNLQERERLVDRLVATLEAWELFDADRENPAARARLRSQIAGLPGSFARHAGVAVGASRAPYPAGRYQPIHTMYWPPHRDALEGHLERLEIEYNIRQVRNTTFRYGSFREHLHYFIEHRDNPYNIDQLTEEQKQDIEKQYAESLTDEHGNDSRFASVTGTVSERPEPVDLTEMTPMEQMDKIHKTIQDRTDRKNRSLDLEW